MNQEFYDVIEANPVIAAIKDEKGLKRCCELEEIKVVFVLHGDICNIVDTVDALHKAGKIAIVHADLMEGMSAKEAAIEYIKKVVHADGIISTKPLLIKKARELSLYTILRVFVLDSIALKNIEQQLILAKPDMLEILPGLMPKIIRQVSKESKVPVIAGGLISEKKDVVDALLAGAISVSTTNPDVWIA